MTASPRTWFVTGSSTGIGRALVTELLARGDTLGVFQLDGGPMRDLLRRMQPTGFEDVVAVIALYRPGPMGMNAHNDYADRKNQRKPIAYLPAIEHLKKAHNALGRSTCFL